jgi:hypothetical protein
MGSEQIAVKAVGQTEAAVCHVNSLIISVAVEQIGLDQRASEYHSCHSEKRHHAKFAGLMMKEICEILKLQPDGEECRLVCRCWC